MERHGIESIHQKSESEKALAHATTEGERQAILKAAEATREEQKTQAVNRMRGVLKVISGEYASPFRLKALLQRWLWQTELHVIQRQEQEKKRILQVEGAMSVRHMMRNLMVQRLCFAANTILEEVMRHLCYNWRNNCMLAVIDETQNELDANQEARAELTEAKRIQTERKKVALLTMTVQRWADQNKWQAVSNWQRNASAYLHEQDIHQQISAIEEDFRAQKHVLELAIQNLAQSGSTDAASKAAKVAQDQRDLRKKQAAAMCLACLIRVRKMWKLKAVTGFRWNMKEDLVLERDLKHIAELHDNEREFNMGARGARHNFAISCLRRNFQKHARATDAGVLMDWRLNMKEGKARKQELHMQAEKLAIEGRLSHTGKHAGIALLAERLTKWHRGAIASIVGKWRTNCSTARGQKFVEDVKNSKRRIADLKKDGKKALLYDLLGSKLLVMGEQLLVLRQGVVARLVNNWRREAYMEVEREKAIMKEMQLMSELMQQSVDLAAISRRGRGVATPAEYGRMSREERGPP